MRKGEGTITGAAFIEWDNSYSFNWDARNIAVETLVLLPTLPEPPSGTLEFNASGVGSFDDPRYVVRGTVVDLFIGVEEVGQVTGRLDVRDGTLSLDPRRRVVNHRGVRFRTGGADRGERRRPVVPGCERLARSLRADVRAGVVAVHEGGGQRLDAYRRRAAELGPSGRRGHHRAGRPECVRLRHPQRWAGPIVTRPAGSQYRPVAAGGGRARRSRCRASVDLATEAVSLGVDGDANLGILQGFFQDLRASGDASVRADVTGPCGSRC